MVKLVAEGGSIASVTPQSWLFLGSYKKLRATLLQRTTLNLIGALGSRAFETISGEVVNTALITLSACKPIDTSTFCGVDAIEASNPQSKATELLSGSISLLKQEDQHNDPESKITVRQNSMTGQTLRELASVLVGATTGDSPRYIFKFWNGERSQINGSIFKQLSKRQLNLEE